MGKTFRLALAIEKNTVTAFLAWFVAAHEFAHRRRDVSIVRIGGYTALDWPQAIAARPDGIIGTLNHLTCLTQRDVGRAKVVLLSNTSNHRFSRVSNDDVEAGRIAAKHLISRRLQHFAFVGWSIVPFSEMRRGGFEETVTAQPELRLLPSIDLSLPKERHVPSDDWFASLPKPCGIVCANDGMAVRMINRACELGLRVPEDLLIIGVDDDPFHCFQAAKTLTSVAVRYGAIGTLAAETVDGLMRGTLTEPMILKIPPGEVVHRESTAAFGVSDAVVAEALGIIHAEDIEPVTVKSLIQRLEYVSRRSLELRFRSTMGHTIYQEIIHARVTRAQQLLRSTPLKIDEIAYRAGFADVPHFSRPFKRIVGQTPSAYRKSYLTPGGAPI